MNPLGKKLEEREYPIHNNPHIKKIKYGGINLTKEKCSYNENFKTLKSEIKTKNPQQYKELSYS